MMAAITLLFRLFRYMKIGAFLFFAQTKMAIAKKYFCKIALPHWQLRPDRSNGFGSYLHFWSTVESFFLLQPSLPLSSPPMSVDSLYGRIHCRTTQKKVGALQNLKFVLHG